MYQKKTIKEFKSNGNKSAVEACFNIKDLKAPKTDTKGKKWWEGNKEEMFNSKNTELLNFLNASGYTD